MGIGPEFEVADENALFHTPELDGFEPASNPLNYGEDLNNDELFRDADEAAPDVEVVHEEPPPADHNSDFQIAKPDQQDPTQD